MLGITTESYERDCTTVVVANLDDYEPYYKVRGKRGKIWWYGDICRNFAPTRSTRKKSLSRTLKSGRAEKAKRETKRTNKGSMKIRSSSLYLFTSF